MSNEKLSLETTYKLWDDQHGNVVATVKPDTDGHGLIEVWQGEPSRGVPCLTLSKAQARLLIQALNLMATAVGDPGVIGDTGIPSGPIHR